MDFDKAFDQFRDELEPAVQSYLSISPTADASSIRTNLAFLRIVRNWALDDVGLNEKPPRGQFALLRTVFFTPEQRLPHAEIARALEVSGAYVTTLIDALVEQGLIERVVKKDDRRVSYASLTDRGREACMEHIPTAIKNMETHFAGFTPAEKETLQRLLSKIHINLTKSRTSESTGVTS